MERTKENRGITLIALVITIIVLLILAGVTIAMLTGENGILKQAQNAKEVSARTNAEEELLIEWANVQAEAIINNLESRKMGEMLQEKLKLKDPDATVVYDKKKKVYTETYNLSSTYSGYSDQTVTKENLNWRVLNINSNGKVDIISEIPTSHIVGLGGSNGYNNGVYLLNDKLIIWDDEPYYIKNFENSNGLKK